MRKKGQFGCGSVLFYFCQKLGLRQKVWVVSSDVSTTDDSKRNHGILAELCLALMAALAAFFNQVGILENTNFRLKKVFKCSKKVATAVSLYENLVLRAIGLF